MGAEQWNRDRVIILARAHQFLAETLRAKAELMTQMGHEIRTPLNGVVGMTELLLSTTLNDEQREYANAAMTSATGLMVVINDVLDFSMLEAGTLELDVGTFELWAEDEASKVVSNRVRFTVESSYTHPEK